MGEYSAHYYRYTFWNHWGHQCNTTEGLCDFYAYVWEGVDTGTMGKKRPPTIPKDLTTRGWSYDVWRINSTKQNLYEFLLSGDQFGSMGAESFFLGRVVIMNKDVSKNQYFNVTMTTPTSGRLSVTVPDGDNQILLVVASVPQHFHGHQTFGYEVNIKGPSDDNKIHSSVINVTPGLSPSNDEVEIIMENLEEAEIDMKNYNLEADSKNNGCVIFEDDDYLHGFL